MTTPERPSWLTQAIANHHTAAAVPPSTVLAPGQVRRLEHMDAGASPTRLVLVVDIDADQFFATVMVLSPDTDMGGSHDRLVVKHESGLPYDLVALTDVAGPAWFVQMGPVLATLNNSLDAHLVAGVPLRDAKDARWQWKEGELDALIALTAECRYQLLDSEPSTIADPLAFDLDRVGLYERTSIVSATFQLAKQHRVLIPAEALDEALVPMNHQGSESFEALLLTAGRHRELLLPFSHPIDHATEPLELRHLANDSLANVLTAVAKRVHSSIRCIRIASVSSLWRDEHVTGEPLFWSVDLGGRRHQVVVSEVDILEPSDA